MSFSKIIFILTTIFCIANAETDVTKDLICSEDKEQYE